HYLYLSHPLLHSFPTRRSSDLGYLGQSAVAAAPAVPGAGVRGGRGAVPEYERPHPHLDHVDDHARAGVADPPGGGPRRHGGAARSEEHTSELQSLAYLVCRLLL